MTTLIFRKKSRAFHSIENVFKTLLPFLNVRTLELTHSSEGMFNRLKNIRFLFNENNNLIHITGHDHYLLWWRFKKCILTIHDIEALNRKRGVKKWLFKKLWFDVPIRNAKLVTTISEFSRNELLRLNNYKTPIIVINNPITINVEFTPKEFNTQRPRILHLGTKNNKNLVRTIKALAGISCQLVIIGEKSKVLIDLLNSKNIQFTFKSQLTNKQVVEEYKACDFVMFVSTYEGFGLPIIEAQAIGRPVVTSKISSMPEVAGNAALLVDPFSVESIHRGVKKIISDKELRIRLISSGRENVNRFKPEIIAREYAKLYEKLNNE